MPFLTLTSNEDDDFELRIRQGVEGSKEGTGVIVLNKMLGSGEPGGGVVDVAVKNVCVCACLCLTSAQAFAPLARAHPLTP